MRKYQKQQILEIVDELHSLHQKCRGGLSEREYQTVQSILTDCQETAIQIGEFIESLEGEGTQAVSYLEQYCETLYQVSTQLEEIPAHHVYKRLEGILIKAQNEIAHTHIRREVVFLPYKASMWDSLESVYLAAREDEDCDAYVVPIPYYDKNADGSFGAMHYEGEEYPDNIEITYFEAYNLEQRHPDVIYIHNPYDDRNAVTSVPERYYSRNLRKYTDCLVYIPYFILPEIEPDDQAAIDKMKPFCFMPGVVWAHKVILQSEKMRQIYINELIKVAKINDQSEAYTYRKGLENKILGLGSPKLDRVHAVCKEDIAVPEEWRKVIENSDGTWKKIILYNTGVASLLQRNMEMIEKMKRVFETFREQREKVALLWRPHPLILSTIKTMRPELRAEYEKLVENYRAEGWGIYDDSADVDRAVVLSDAYYGDMSSIVQLYQETGKPVMIQNVEAV